MRWLLILMCACNQVYGLAETSPPDSDGDRVSDDTDNCPLVPNRDQHDADRDHVGDACDPCANGPQLALDEDGDGVDDACDSCLSGANHDEDGDGVGDGCDVCPADPDDQADADDDGVGDACDHAPGVANARVVFDGFAPPRPDWNVGFQQWSTGDGETFGAIAPLAGRWGGAWSPAAKVPSLGWSIRAELKLPPLAEATPSRTFGIEAVLTGGAMSGRTCGLYRGAAGWLEDRTRAPITVGDTIRVELRERAAPAITSECYIDGTLVSTRTFGGTFPEHYVWLWAAIGAEFKWLDVVR